MTREQVASHLPVAIMSLRWKLTAAVIVVLRPPRSRVRILKKRGKIVVLHFAGRMPLAGIAWQAMHYLLGLRQLGWDAWYVEDSGANPYDPRAESVAMACGYNLAYLRRAMAGYGFGERWVYWDAINDVHHGLSRDRLRV